MTYDEGKNYSVKNEKQLKGTCIHVCICVFYIPHISYSPMRVYNSSIG